MSEIDGIVVRPLKRISDERGSIFHMLRADDENFSGFGEIYFSMVYPGVVKGWHFHERMTLNYAVPIGMIKMVCFDDRSDSSTRGNIMEIVLGDLNYCLVTVPIGIWNGFKGIGTTPALVANCASIPHDPTEITRLDPIDNSIPYDWSLKHG